MGIDPPFLYERPSSFRWDASLDRGFNPRAATEEAWLKAQREKEKEEKPKVEGPLINPSEFNKHPDSYMIISYDNVNHKSPGKNTKRTITWLRWFQLVMRVCEVFGFAGLLACMILIIPTGEGIDWTIRVPPAVAIVHALYGCWHLSRRPGGRTAPSSASYFIFSAIVDATLVPFMFFSAWILRQQWVTITGGGSAADGAWKTLVDKSSPSARVTVVFVAWVVSVTLAGMSLACFLIDAYLGYQFRQISYLPPDMNPFEENLTRGRSTRNKKPRRETLDLPISVSDSARNSTASLLTEKGPAVPWTHTRNDSSTTLTGGSPVNSPKPRPDSGISMTSTHTTQALGPYMLSNGSSGTLSNPKRRQGHTRNDSTGGTLPPKARPESPLRKSMVSPYNTAPSTPVKRDEESNLKAPSREPNASPGAVSSVYSETESWYTDVPEDSRSLHSRLSNKAASARPQAEVRGPNWPLVKSIPEKPDQEWFTVGDISDSENEEHAMSGREIPEFVHLRSAPSHPVSSTPPKDKYDFSSRSPRPLEMNPPTPPIGRRPQSDLPAARSAFSYQRLNPTTPESHRKSHPQSQFQRHTGSPSANREARRQRIALQPASPATPNWSTPNSTRMSPDTDSSTQALLPNSRAQARVISSGYEGERHSLSMRNSNIKGRQVSGKVAEEGRAGASWRITSGMTALRHQMGW